MGMSIFFRGAVGVRFRPVAERFTTRGPLPLVKCVAVWMPMLTHVQASHTDALKTHSLQTFLPQDWKTKKGQRPRKKIDIGGFLLCGGDSRTGRSLFSIAVQRRKYQACVLCMPILLRLCCSASAHGMKRLR